jgi:putative transposase
MIKAHHIRLNPTDEQRAYFVKAAGTARYAYNWAVEQWRAAEGKKPGAIKLKQRFNAQKPAWAYEVTKCACEGAFFDFADALRNFYEGRAQEPQFKSRSRGNFSFYLSNDKFDISGRWIRIPKLGLVNMAEKLRLEGRILGATVSKEADWWYVSVTVEMPDVRKTPKPERCGIDLGIVRLATLSNGESFDNPRPLKRSLQRLARLQRLFARTQKGSRNRERLKCKIGRLHKEVRDIRNDLLHKLTTKLAGEYGFIAVETLNLKGMSKNHALAQALQDAALGRLLELLGTKVLAEGGELVKVDTFFPSSRICSACGHKREKLSLSERTFVCSHPECGLVIDRDLNAAINILNEGLRIAASHPPSGSGYDGR